MISKISKAAMAAVMCTSLASCGARVAVADVQGQTERQLSDSSTMTSEITGENSAEEIGAPAEPQRPAAPEKVSVDTDMPSGYKLPEKVVMDFESVLQTPELPTGCEVTALTETLNFYGFDVDKVYLSDELLPKDFNGYYFMDEAYVGDPHSDNGFGCYAPVIVRTADDYFDCIQSDWYAKDLTGSTLEQLFYQIDQGRPVIVWVTMDLRETYPNYKFTTGNGSEFMFNDYQHCVAIYGYDYKTKTINTADPLNGNVEYDMDQFNKIYEIQGNQAVVLLGNEESAGVVYATEEEMDQWFDENRPGDTQGLEYYIDLAAQECEDFDEEG